MKQQPKVRTISARGMRIAIVAARYNQRYVDGMLRAARSVLGEAGATDVRVIRVPGAFEIPLAASRLAEAGCDAVICLGLIWQGETAHAQHIGEAVTHALMRIQVETGVPMIHEVLQVATAEQARARCLEPRLNRGSEAARTAIEMVRLMRQLAASGNGGK
jgi:6,7-dimethyl-8-ribityllumazine synthase